jgi:hypothetical protein
MKKDALKKLTLSRETLRQLDAGSLRDAVGGGRTYNTCDVSGCLECLPDPT